MLKIQDRRGMTAMISSIGLEGPVEAMLLLLVLYMR